MNRLLWNRFIILLLLIGCKREQKLPLDAASVISENGTDIPVYDFESFKPLLHYNDDKIRIINFWATWCKPCVEELPFFELINSKYKDENVEVILVSLDLLSQVESKLIPFMKRQRIESKVLLLDDPDANAWISQVNKNWTGAIPATLIYNGNNRQFYEDSFTYNELEKELKKML